MAVIKIRIFTALRNGSIGGKPEPYSTIARIIPR
jgi:hypothetical protein